MPIVFPPPAAASSSPASTGYEPGEILKYDGSTFTIDPNTAERGAEMEPQLLQLYRRWQDAITLGLTCEPHCKAEYDAVKAVYDAL